MRSLPNRRAGGTADAMSFNRVAFGTALLSDDPSALEDEAAAVVGSRRASALDRNGHAGRAAPLLAIDVLLSQSRVNGCTTRA
jgi:hypothetical protein